MSDEKSDFLAECDDIAKEIDNYFDQKDFKGLSAYLTKVESLYSTQSTPEYGPLFYFLGTGKSALARNTQHLNIPDHDKDAEAKKLRQWALFYLRKAISMIESAENNATLLLSLYNNYANELDACGRVIEALRIYRKAIALYPNFGMLVGNYGRVLNTYANMVNDSGHYKDLHCYAYQALKQSVSIQDPNMHPEAIRGFEAIIKNYESQPNADYLAQPIEYPEYDLGSDAEKEYRLWCLKHHLFLNPLNDTMEQESAFAHDPLTITTLREDVDLTELEETDPIEPPRWYSMLNQLKEEYVYSRYLCYEGSEKRQEVHYADKDVTLSLSSASLVNYSIRIEQLKSAFKNLYSILDQIGFFVNDFWKLGFTEKQADAHHVFSECKSYPTNNLALAALKWSYSEFRDTFGNADSASEKDLVTIRNALEHKFLKVHEYSTGKPIAMEKDGFYHIGEDELKSFVLRLLELSREWIMYLVYAVGIEESKKETSKKAVHMNIQDYDDTWKV